MKNKYKIIRVILIVIFILNFPLISKANNLEENIKINNSIDEKIAQDMIQSKLQTPKNVEGKNVKIVNTNTSNEIIQGNTFTILDRDENEVEQNLTTDDKGEINIKLDVGQYYLKQTASVSNYSIMKGYVEFEIEGTETITINIKSTIDIQEEHVVTGTKTINVTEQNTNQTQDNLEKIINIENNNINQKITEQSGQTTLKNTNKFINTTYSPRFVNLERTSTYQNTIQDYTTPFVKGQTDGPEYKEMTKEQFLEYIDLIMKNGTKYSYITRNDVINSIDMIMQRATKNPILPVASK